jgi:molecular chaperone DnaK
MIHQAEKVIKDNADKIPADVKTEVEGKLEALKTAAKGSDSKALQRQMDEFNESLQKIGTHIYQQGGADGAPSAAAHEDGQEAAGEKKKEDDVVDADYREVN